MFIIMELLELTNKLKEIFVIEDIKYLGVGLKNCVLNNDVLTYDAFVNAVEGDLTQDWLQKVYQYNLADRAEKKQDFTPQCLATLLNAIIGNSETVVDMCAGSGALTIQRWVTNPNQRFELYEIDENVMPFLLFNLCVRNIDATVHLGDVLSDEFATTYRIKKGAKYGAVVSI